MDVPRRLVPVAIRLGGLEVGWIRLVDAVGREEKDPGGSSLGGHRAWDSGVKTGSSMSDQRTTVPPAHHDSRSEGDWTTGRLKPRPPFTKARGVLWSRRSSADRIGGTAILSRGHVLG